MCLQRRDGFSLPALVMAVAAATLIFVGLGLLAGALFQSEENYSVSYNGQAYSLAPSYVQFQNAMALHFAFQSACDQADGIYIYGGADTHPVNDPVGPSVVLSKTLSILGPLTTNGASSLRLQSGWESKTVYSDFTSQFVNAGSAADFSVITVQGRSRVTSVTHQRRYSVTINGRVLQLYEVNYQPYDWSSSSPVAGSSSAYRICYRASEDSWSVPLGVRHAWYRVDPSWARIQEGPARLTFADPATLSADPTAPTVHAGSRFDYFLAVVR